MDTTILFWAIAAALALLAGMWLALPLVSRRGDAGDRFSDKPGLRVHRAALEEVDRDLAAGLINQEDADAAKVEIQRRMLKEAEEDRTDTATNGRGPRPGFGALILGGVPILAVALYLVFGSPGAPDMPLAAREGERQQINLDRARVQEEIRDLRAALTDDPSDFENWVALGAAHREIGDLNEAEGAFRKALERRRTPGVLVRLADVHITRGEGVVTPRARELLQEALLIAPAMPQARYLLGLAKLQEGDPEGALRDWLALEGQVPADTEWAMILDRAMERAADEAGVDLETARAEFRAEAPSAPAATARGPSQEDVAAAQQMTDQDRAAFIDGMVARLSTRLEENPEDVDGWLQLARSYRVLGREEEMRRALEQAVKHGPDRPDAHVNYAFSLYSPEDLQAGEPIPQAAILAMQKALEINPDQVEALLLLGIRDAQIGHPDGAREKWGRILTVLDPENPLFDAVERRIDALPSG